MPITINPTTDPTQLTSSAKEMVKTQNAPFVPSEAPLDKKVKKVHDEFRQRIDICKNYRRKLIANWTVNIDYRRGKPFTSQTDEDQVAVNLDWSLTKAKQSALFSQVPQVRLDHGGDTLPKTAPWASKFAQKLNEALIVAGIEAAMDECLPDVINAAGIGAVLVSFESISEDRQVPLGDPSTQVEGEQPEMISVPVVLDKRYVVQRISPADLLWPINFTGSNFDTAPWVGRSGRVTWAEAVQKFGLKEDDKESVLGEDRPTLDRLSHDIERDKAQADEIVGFDEVFYWDYQFDPVSKSFSTIHHLVFVSGKDKPVIDEPWKGQQVDENGAVLGALKFPLRVLTLTYVTDETIPPSDSAIGRPQVNEINKARTQMIKQRERSLPIRWFNVDRIDPTIQQSLMRGTWQAMIPVQGEGTRVIGEIARASMPVENFKFDQIAKFDLHDEWTAPQSTQQKSENGKPGEEEPFNPQLGRERAKVGSFFVGISEVLGGLLCLYEDAQVFGEGFSPDISKTLRYSILADSTVLLSATQKLARLNQFVNAHAKSGWVNVEPVMQEIAILSGLDPNLVIKAPSPKPPVEPNISLRLTGVEDMLNPLALAFLIKSGQAPAADLIEQAKALIQQAVVPPQNMQLQAGPLAPGGAPMLPGGITPQAPDGSAAQAGQAPSGPPLPPPVAGPPPGAPTPPPQPPKMGEAHPQWTTMPALDKRTDGKEK